MTLTRNCELLSMNISNKELDLMNMLTIFEKEEKENIVDLDDDLKIITMANGSKFKFSQLQNMNYLVEKYRANENLNLFSIMFGSDTILKSDKNEVDEYLKLDQMPATTNSLNWWKDAQKKFLILASLVCKYLAIPSMSTPSECLFSSTGNLITAKHTSINTGLFERILFLKRNISILGTIFESQSK
ncbi:15896_t:CDS:2 [Gigaspora margarita]|uniref:15896_t:CDS:1 n=1 Tax=Gigaspora margarita TaxID=4874 RepID=A0ABN7VZE3_GIGMA|nr:15896_t:CDS:2 [Gigaspora margarita]